MKQTLGKVRLSQQFSIIHRFTTHEQAAVNCSADKTTKHKERNNLNCSQHKDICKSSNCGKLIHQEISLCNLGFRILQLKFQVIQVMLLNCIHGALCLNSSKLWIGYVINDPFKARVILQCVQCN